MVLVFGRKFLKKNVFVGRLVSVNVLIIVDVSGVEVIRCLVFVVFLDR